MISFLKKIIPKKIKEYIKYHLQENAFLKKSDIIVLGAPHNKYNTVKFPSNKNYIDIWGIIRNK